MITTDKPRYKVLIPTAGIGSRLNQLTKYLNKSLVDIAGKPVISRIIESFPGSCEFVIPLGYKGNLVKQFLELAYPNRNFYFTYVDNYEGKGSGLGLSILSAEKYLQEPFVFSSCDTITENEIPYPDKNIAFYSKRINKRQYRTLEIVEGKVVSILEKDEDKENSMPYIGLACINNWQLFWDIMNKGGIDAVKDGESYALREFSKNKMLYANEAIWFDTGNIEELSKTIKHFECSDTPNILPKPDEAIWFINGKVIKFSNNKNFIKERVERAEFLCGFVPKVTDYRENMYVYDEKAGIVLSKIKNIDTFKKLLGYSETFWISVQEPHNFKEICKKFYYNKTLERIELYYKTFSMEDKELIVNGTRLPKLSEILNDVDWDSIFSGLAGRFHGDFHFENILYNEENGNFVFLDWRQNFGGLLNCGDIYYDLAKLLHGLIICHELIVKNCYSVEINEDNVNFSFERKSILVECEKYFYDWLKIKNYDVQKVKVLTALIYLNIAPLHHYPYCHLLYNLGKSMLYSSIKNKDLQFT